MNWKGISAEVLSTAGVTIADGMVSVPYRLVTGEVCAVRVVAADGHSAWRDSDSQVPLGLEHLGSLHDPSVAEVTTCLVVEGEANALACRQAYDGMVDVLGAPDAVWRPGWAAFLDGFREVVAFGSGDESGRTFIRAVKRSLPNAATAEMPEDLDAREVLQQYGAEAMDAIIDHALTRRSLKVEIPVEEQLEALEKLIAIRARDVAEERAS